MISMDSNTEILSVEINVLLFYIVICLGFMTLFILFIYLFILQAN